MKLFGYWRSSAAYRVRIALNMKQLTVDQVSVHLVKNGGEQHLEAFTKINPQALVPALLLQDSETLECESNSDGSNADSSLALSQSIAIIEYLEELSAHVSLLPSSLIGRAQVRAMAMTIACDVHPLNNLRVLQYLTTELGIDEKAKNAWYQHWIVMGFTALEEMIAEHGGAYCFGDQVTLADICLVPQVYNAERFNIDLTPYPNIKRVSLACNQLPAFIDAAPENQPDAI